MIPTLTPPPRVRSASRLLIFPRRSWTCGGPFGPDAAFAAHHNSKIGAIGITYQGQLGKQFCVIIIATETIRGMIVIDLSSAFGLG
jgi:hypothetical protein